MLEGGGERRDDGEETVGLEKTADLDSMTRDSKAEEECVLTCEGVCSSEDISQHLAGR